jgi:branched-chain amino acid transport system ATP-binding protein
MHPLLQLDNLSKRFGGLVAVDRVSFDIRSGEIFGLIGPNGAGKTTLFNLITGLIPASSGVLQFQDQRLNGLPPHRIAACGLARTFQNLRLFGELSALENVQIGRHLLTRESLGASLGRSPQSHLAEQQTREAALDLLALVGLGDLAQQQARTLAYGDQRRLEIARALALEPKLLLLDEPAAGMNPSEKHALSDLIRSIRQRFDLTVLLIEHHVPLVMGLCDRLAVLDFGRLIALGTPEAVRQDPAVIAAYLGEDA